MQGKGMWGSGLLAIAVLVGLCASTAAAKQRPMWNPFVSGSSWGMTSNLNGHVTAFGVRRLHRWGCWTGDIVDLWNVKQAPGDYWGPGSDAAGHQIMLHAKDGSWRMVGTYAASPDPTQRWTMQIHRYPGRPVPYVIVPGQPVASDTRTAYFTLYRPRIMSSCLQGGEQAAPTWGRNVYWRSRFMFSATGDLRAHYEENTVGCGPPACQVEDWTFARKRTGIARIAVSRSGGRPMSLVLR